MKHWPIATFVSHLAWGIRRRTRTLHTTRSTSFFSSVQKMASSSASVASAESTGAGVNLSVAPKEEGVHQYANSKPIEDDAKAILPLIDIGTVVAAVVTNLVGGKHKPGTLGDYLQVVTAVLAAIVLANFIKQEYATFGSNTFQLTWKDRENIRENTEYPLKSLFHAFVDYPKSTVKDQIKRQTRKILEEKNSVMNLSDIKIQKPTSQRRRKKTRSRRTRGRR